MGKGILFVVVVAAIAGANALVKYVAEFGWLDVFAISFITIAIILIIKTYNYGVNYAK